VNLQNLKLKKKKNYFVKFGLPVFDGSDPLLDGGLDAVRGELFLGDLVVVAGINPDKKIGH